MLWPRSIKQHVTLHAASVVGRLLRGAGAVPTLVVVRRKSEGRQGCPHGLGRRADANQAAGWELRVREHGLALVRRGTTWTSDVGERNQVPGSFPLCALQSTAKSCSREASGSDFAKSLWKRGETRPRENCRCRWDLKSGCRCRKTRHTPTSTTKRRCACHEPDRAEARHQGQGRPVAVS